MKEMVKYGICIVKNNAPLPDFVLDCKLLNSKVIYNMGIDIDNIKKFNNFASADFYGSKIIEQDFTEYNISLDLCGTTATYSIIKI